MRVTIEGPPPPANPDVTITLTAKEAGQIFACVSTLGGYETEFDAGVLYSKLNRACEPVRALPAFDNGYRTAKSVYDRWLDRHRPGGVRHDPRSQAPRRAPQGTLPGLRRPQPQAGLHRRPEHGPERRAPAARVEGRGMTENGIYALLWAMLIGAGLWALAAQIVRVVVL